MRDYPDDIWNSLPDDHKRYELLNYLLSSLYVISTEGPFSWAIDRRHDGIRAFFNKDIAPEAGDKRNFRRAVFDLIKRVNDVHYFRINSAVAGGFNIQTSGGLDAEKLADGSTTRFWREASSMAEKCLERLRDAERKNKNVFKDFPDLQENLIGSLEEIIQEGNEFFGQMDVAPASPNIGPSPN